MNETNTESTRVEKFTCFRSFWETAQDLDNPKVRLEYLEAIFRYAFEGIEPNFEASRDEAIRIAITSTERQGYFTEYKCAIGSWKGIRPNIKANIKKRQDGKSGGRPPKSQS